jgi:hypothetical protein
MSPSRRSALAGSPWAFSESTATSTTVRLTSAAENGRRSIRSAGLNRPGPGTISGSPAPPGVLSRATFPPGAGDGWRHGAGRQQLDAAERLVVAVAEPRGQQAEAGLDATERRSDEGLGAAVDKEHDPAVAGDRRLRPRRAIGRAPRLPAPRRPDRRSGQGGQRQPDGGLEPSVQAVAQ